MKKLIFILVMCCICNSLLAYNYDFSSVCSTGQTLYYQITNTTTHEVAVTYPNRCYQYPRYTYYCYFTQPSGNIIIPDSVLSNNITYKVTKIGECAFHDCSGITSLTIPNSVTTIGNSAFYNCSGITSLTIPNSVTTIGNYAFQNCSGITSLTIPNSVTTIDNSAFYNCSGITSLTIGDSVTTIGNYAFYNCNDIKTITFGKSLQSVGYEAFYRDNPYGYSAHVMINSVDTIYFNAKNYTGIVWQNSSLKVLTIGNSVTTIGNSAFYNCSGLTSLTIPNSVTTIGNSAFYNCSGITNLTIPNSVTTIGNSAFSYCSGITSLTIPNSVDTIGSEAFYNIGTQISYDSLDLSGTRYIGQRAFYDRDWILAVKTNANIQREAFANCDRLMKITLGDSVKMVGQNAFAGCYRLTEVNFGKNIDAIGMQAFEGCIRLLKPNLPDSLKYIGEKAFRRCKLFSGSFTIPKNVSYIGSNAFDSCSSINALVMKGEPPTIVANTFSTISLNIPVYVPCGKVTDYYVTNYWENFTNIRETAPYKVSVVTDTIMGNVVLLNEPNCQDSIARASATANYGYHFLKWEDGSIDNPRQVKINKDSVLVAIFAQNNEYITVQTADATKGSVSGSGMYSYMENVQINAVANNGYHFLTWNDGNRENPRTVLASQDSVFTAYFVSNNSIITVENANEDMGNVSGSGVFYYNNYITITATANYGYHFTQWSDGVTSNPRTVLVVQDSTFTAQFAINTYSISVNSDNTTQGTVQGGGNYNYNIQVGISAEANYGYHFVQWNDGNTNNPRTIIVDKDSSFTAQFAANSYVVEVVSNDANMGSAYGSGTYSYNTQITLAANAAYGYHFSQWSDGNTDNPRIVSVSGMATYTAMFEINTYDIVVNSFNPAMGGAAGGGTFNYNTPINITATPQYGYHFTQWSDGNTDNPRLVNVIQNATYTAQFAINSYAVNVQTNNTAKGNVSGSGSFIYNNTTATLTATANYGYHFTQWNDGNTDNPRTVIVTQDMSYTAQFDNNNYTITANSNNIAIGNIAGAGTYEYNSVISLTAQPNEHYHFIMWNDSITDNPRTLTVTQDSIFTAYFAIDTHQVVLYSNDNNKGTVSSGGAYKYGSSVPINATANYGYHFTQWSDGNTNNPRTINLTQDTTLTALFTENDYLLSLYSNDTNKGNVYGNGSYTYLSQATATATSNYGYHFVSWSDNNTDNPRNISITKDTLLTAIFTENDYLLTLYSNDTAKGNVTGSGTFAYLSQRTINATANYGYHFTQWSDGNTNNPRTINLTQDTTLTALFTENNYLLTLYSNDTLIGEVNGSGTYTYLTNVTIEATSIEGYHFVQWSDGNTDNPRIINITSDSVLTAVFAIDVYQVGVLSNDDSAGNTVGSGSYDYNTVITITANANEHYHFVSWSDGNTSNPRSITVVSDSIFVALFQEDNKYNIQVVSSDINKGTVDGEGYYYEGSKVNIKATANEHYHFTRWSDGNTDNPRLITVISDNIYIANFEKDKFFITVESSDINQGIAQGGGRYEYGDSITIQALANDGYHFIYWNDGNTETTRIVEVTQNKTYIANFGEGAGLENIDNKDIFVLYPNPAKDEVVIEGLIQGAIIVTDNIGRVVKVISCPNNQRRITIDVANFLDGVYYVKIGTKTKKLIVSKQ